MHALSSRYQIQEVIGHGGAGTVYKALDTQLDRPVAIKKLHTVEGSASQTAIIQIATASLLREAKTLSAIQHPNIVTLYDMGVDEEGPYVVMEYLDGQTLEEAIEHAPFPMREFTMLAKDVLNGLLAAHSRNILHRDMKPANIKLVWLSTGELKFKILDFGLAKFSAIPSVQTMDMKGGVMGSIHFMAPEQFERGLLDARTDLYSTGCVFYHALTARYPFTGKTEPQVMMSHMYHQVGPLAELRPDLSQPMVDWVLKFMQRDPNDRHQSTAEAMQSFQEALAEGEAGTTA
jgi:serine/threonine-protein kinase